MFPVSSRKNFSKIFFLLKLSIPIPLSEISIARAGRLLAIAQGGVKNDELLGHGFSPCRCRKLEKRIRQTKKRPAANACGPFCGNGKKDAPWKSCRQLPRRAPMPPPARGASSRQRALWNMAAECSTALVPACLAWLAHARRLQPIRNGLPVTGVLGTAKSCLAMMPARYAARPASMAWRKAPAMRT